MQATIRPFVAIDAEPIKRVTAAAFGPVSIDRNIEDRFGVINERDWQWRKMRHIEEDIQRQSSGIFVAEMEGQIIGYVTTFADHQTGIGHIPNLAVMSEHRGQGIGRRLIEHALDHFLSLGLSHARIETLDQNPIGQQLYPSLGFQEVARQIHYCMPLSGRESAAGR